MITDWHSHAMKLETMLADRDRQIARLNLTIQREKRQSDFMLALWLVSIALVWLSEIIK